MPELAVAFSSLFILIVLAAFGIYMKQACKFQLPANPVWPFAESPGLALELADSTGFVDQVLGAADPKVGPQNRKAAELFQKLDFVFIPLYTLFFAVSAWQREKLPGAWPVIGLAILTAIFDVVENIQVLRLLKKTPGASAKGFGKTKWMFYFATLGMEGYLFFSVIREAGATTGALLGALVMAVAVIGIWQAVRGSFSGIAFAAKLSALCLPGLAFAPLLSLVQLQGHNIAEYIILMRVPLIIALLLAVLPVLAFRTGARSLLRGLFDLTPLSLFAVTLTTVAVAGMVCTSAYIVLNDGYLRFGIHKVPDAVLPAWWGWLLIILALSLPVIISSIRFSIRQNHKEQKVVWYINALLSGVAVSFGVAFIHVYYGDKIVAAIRSLVLNSALERFLQSYGTFRGYVQMGATADPFADHILAFIAFSVTIILYIIIGFYGRAQLGKRRTVPALCSALMLMLVLGWMLSALTFFFDAWRIPLLLILAVIGTITAQSADSDHFYKLRDRRNDSVEAPDPVTAIHATKQPGIIVVAANGGGIQAGAWAAQVLYGLYQDCGEPFQKSLRMISSVSGGSVGSACFVHWLANKTEAREPDEAAAMSSLDEVAWGLSWPDLLRGFFPWIFAGTIGRGRALEEAWCLNSAKDLSTAGKMDEPLSSWNKLVATGELPAMIMNATIAETGERLLLGTTRLAASPAGQNRARQDATTLHTIDGKEKDVSVVTAARLSASFPYVTPAARSDAPGPRPHAVDGGYYDNYGMATMVEWLHEALSGNDNQVKKVLLIQIHGAPTGKADKKEATKNRGWFYQAFAPLTTLFAVRSTGQIAHNDIELEFLVEIMKKRGIDIKTVIFEFSNLDAALSRQITGEEEAPVSGHPIREEETPPLSWHLTREEIDNIKYAWENKMQECRDDVKQFLVPPKV